jgi:non-specific serine/threonine protein kinase
MPADTKECPFCSEEIKTTAKKCKHCGEWLPQGRDAASIPAPVTLAPPNTLPCALVKRGQVLDLLSHLVDKNLVVYEEDAHGQGRYRLLETVRQYGRDRLLESGAGEAARQRHLTHFVSLAEEAARHIYGAGQTTWQKRLESEHDNLRAALEWSLTTQGHEEEALRLVGALAQFWVMGSHVREGGEWAARALAMGRNAPPLVLAWALVAAGNAAFDQGDYEAAAFLTREAVQFARAAQDRWWIAYTLFVLGIAVHGSDLEAAQASADEGMALSQEEGDRWLMGRHLVVLGLVAWMRGNYGAARTFFGQTLQVSRDLADEWHTGMSLATLGYVTRRAGDCQEARALHQEGLPLFQRLGDRRGISWHLVGMAGVEAEQGRAERAARLLGAAAAVLEALGSPLPPPQQREYDRTVEQTQALLGEEAFATLWAQGQAMTLEQAVAYALEDEPPEETA